MVKNGSLQDNKEDEQIKNMKIYFNTRQISSE